MRYRIRKDVTVQGVPYSSGTIIDEAELPAGSLECMRDEYLAPHVEEVNNVEVKPAKEPPIIDKKRGK